MPRLRPSWTANLSALIAEGISVIAICDRCKQCQQVDLVALAAKVGAGFDLWNRRPRCRTTPGCEGRILFMHSGRGPMKPMQDKTRAADCSWKDYLARAGRV